MHQKMQQMRSMILEKDRNYGSQIARVPKRLHLNLQFSTFNLQPLSQQLYCKNNHRRQKQQDRQPIDPVHIFHPLCRLIIGIFFHQEKILPYLFQYAHNKRLLKEFFSQTIALSLS